jgi:hypothetical protein
MQDGKEIPNNYPGKQLKLHKKRAIVLADH